MTAAGSSAPLLLCHDSLSLCCHVQCLWSVCECISDVDVLLLACFITNTPLTSPPSLPPPSPLCPGDKFDKYLEAVLRVLKQAMQLSVMSAASGGE